jgi:hypothetical protein
MPAAGIAAWYSTNLLRDTTLSIRDSLSMGTRSVTARSSRRAVNSKESWMEVEAGTVLMRENI